ncbi:MAG: cyclic nucleotide-binding domain-containing protein, partial [Acidobacteria bacterium]
MDPAARRLSPQGPGLTGAAVAATADALRVAARAERAAAPAGAVIWRHPDAPDTLLVVLDGIIECLAADSTLVCRVGPGEIARRPQTPASPGSLLRAVTDVAFARLVLPAGDAADSLAGERVEALAAAVISVVQRRHLLAQATNVFGPLDGEAIRELELDADWVSLKPGDVLMRQGEPGDRLFVLLAGRLEVSREEPGGGSAIVGEVAPGESVGEMSFFTGEPRSGTVRAIRDSLLVCFTNDEFERIIARRPGILRQVTRIQAERLRRANLG